MQKERSREGSPSHVNGCFFGVTEFITEDTDLLELVRNAVESDKAGSEGENAAVRNGIDPLSETNCGSEKQLDIEDTADLIPHRDKVFQSQTPSIMLTKDTNTTVNCQISTITPTKVTNARNQTQKSPNLQGG